MIEIKHRFDGRVLYTAENAQDVRQAVEEAVKDRANLARANLARANLARANLDGANLARANLARANLARANLARANLARANLAGANLDPRHPLYPIRLDVWAILDGAPAEVPALREKMVAGEIDGSAYSGKCACLCGTIAQAQGLADVAELVAIEPDADRPAELWFGPIREGDRPVDDVTAEGVGEGEMRLTLALRWLDEWTESRTAIAKTLAGAEAA